MTVKELIEVLKKVKNQDEEVVVEVDTDYDGYPREIENCKIYGFISYGGKSCISAEAEDSHY